MSHTSLDSVGRSGGWPLSVWVLVVYFYASFVHFVWGVNRVFREVPRKGSWSGNALALASTLHGNVVREVGGGVCFLIINNTE